jgi:hypothetical protein
MADFQTLQQALIKGRSDSEQTRLDLKTSTYRVRLLEQERKELERQKGDNNDEYIRRRSELDRKIRAAKTDEDKKRT